MKTIVTGAMLVLLSVSAGYGEEAAPARYVVLEGSVAMYEASASVFFIPGNSVAGTSKKVTGEFVLAGKTAEGKIVIDAASFDSGVGLRDDHVREILEAAKHPRIVFTLNRAELPGGAVQAGVHAVGGLLEVRGTQKEVSFPVSVKEEGDIMVLEGSVPVKFTDFGMEPPTFGLIIKRANDELTLKARILVKREE